MSKLILFITLLIPALALAAPHSGIVGAITITPTQGGPIRQGAPSAKPLPDTEFVVKQGDEVVKTFRTDGKGHFQIGLPPGHYSVVKKERGKIGSFGPFEVDVAAGKMKSVAWGMRQRHSLGDGGAGDDGQLSLRRGALPRAWRSLSRGALSLPRLPAKFRRGFRDLGFVRDR